MKARVIYHNKPHKVRVQNLHLVSVCKGVWAVYATLKGWQSQEINSWGSDGDGDESVYFGDDETHKECHIRAEIKFLPEARHERCPRLFDGLHKGTYEAVLVSHRCLSRAWDRYLKRRESRIHDINVKKGHT